MTTKLPNNLTGKHGCAITGEVTGDVAGVVTPEFRTKWGLSRDQVGDQDRALRTDKNCQGATNDSR